MKARVRGTELFFDVDGPALVPDGPRMAERPTLLLVPGGPGGDHTSFKPAYGALREVAQLVYLDPRGCGRSAPVDPAIITLDDHADDLAALCDRLGLDRVAVLGGSYGGMVAINFALRHPDRLGHLVLVSTAPSYRFIEDAKRIVRERGTPEQVRACERLWAGAFESMDQLRDYYEVTAPLYSVAHKPERFADSWARGRRSFVALNRGFGDFLRTFDYVPRLGEINCPTLVLCGAHDWICPPNHSRLLAERIPGARLQMFANSSHNLATDEPEAFFQAVREFLTE